MKLRASTTITLGVVSSLAAIVGACTAFSSESSDTPDAGAVEDARSTIPPVSSSAPDTSTPDAGPSPEVDASAPDAAPRECTGGCPGGSFCEDGTCLPTLCTGDGGVVVVRPKRVVDQNGMLTTFPAGSSIRDTVVDRGEGDDDGTYMEAVIGAGNNAAIKIESDFFVLPTNRKIEAVNLRARSRRTTPTASAQIGLIYWFKASASIYGQTIKTNVGTGYDIVNFYVPVPPFASLGTEWTAMLVNDVQVGVEMIGAASNQDNATVRLTQVWVEVCLKAL
ncbi:MAG: hypothetical protein JNM74_00375 [Myxococcales bacterium]|nr:hypothetical protein [Myxococcales bacterium]